MARDEHSEPSFDEGEGAPGHDPSRPGPPSTPDPDWLAGIDPPSTAGEKNDDSGLFFDQFLNDEKSPPASGAKAPEGHTGSGRSHDVESPDDPAFFGTTHQEDADFLRDTGSGETGLLGDPEAGETGFFGEPEPDARPDRGPTGYFGEPGDESFGPSDDLTGVGVPPAGPRETERKPVVEKPQGRGRAAVLAAVLTAAAVPTTALYLSQRNEIRRSQDAAREALRKANSLQSSVAGEEARRKQALKAAEDANALKAQADERLTSVEADAKNARQEATAAQLERDVARKLADQEKAIRVELEKKATPDALAAVEPRLIDEAVGLTLAPATAAEGMRMIVRLAVEKNDQDVVDHYVSRLGDLLKRRDRVDALLKSCQQSLKDTTDKKQRSRYRQIEADLRRALRGLTAGAAPAAGKQGHLRQGTKLEAPGRNASRTPRDRARVLLVAATRFDDAPPADEVQTDEDEIRAADEAIQEDPDNVSAYVKKGRAILDLGRHRERQERLDDARRLFDEAGDAFRAGFERIAKAPALDRRGTTLRRLFTGYADASQARNSLAAPGKSPKTETIRNDLAALRAELKTAREELAKRGGMPAPPGGGDPSAALKAQIAKLERRVTELESQVKQRDARIAQVGRDLKQSSAERDRASATLAQLQAEAKLSDEVAGRLSAFLLKLAGSQQYPPAPPRELSTRAAAAPGDDPWLSGLARQIETKGAVTQGPRPVHLAGVLLATGAYTDGVERLSRNDYYGAETSFSRAIEADPEDARFHYLRGVARYLAAGGPPSPVPVSAADDVKNGVRLERLNQPAARVIGLGLIRVQGDVRNWLESYRQPGRELFSDVPSPRPVTYGLISDLSPDRP